MPVSDSAPPVSPRRSWIDHLPPLEPLLAEGGSVFNRVYRMVDRHLLWRRQERLAGLLRLWDTRAELGPQIMAILPLVAAGFAQRQGGVGPGTGTGKVDAALHDRAVKRILEAYGLIERLSNVVRGYAAAASDPPPEVEAAVREVAVDVAAWDKATAEFIVKKGETTFN